MKQLLEDFKNIYKNDRYIFVLMFGLILISTLLFVTPFLHLTPDVPKVWARYADINKGYAEGAWWYLLSFSLLAVILGLGHSLLAAKLYSKRGRGMAVLFLSVSILLVAVGISILFKILGEA